MASETDWLGNEVTFTHDTDGNTTAQDNDVSTSNPNGTSSTAFSYDNADQNTQATSDQPDCSGSERNPDPVLLGQRPGRATPTASSPRTPRPPTAPPARARPPTSATTATTRRGGSSTRAQPPKGRAQQHRLRRLGRSHHHLQPRLQRRQPRHLHPEPSTPPARSPVRPRSRIGGSTSTYTYDTLGDQTQSVTGSATTNSASTRPTRWPALDPDRLGQLPLHRRRLGGRGHDVTAARCGARPPTSTPPGPSTRELPQRELLCGGRHRRLRDRLQRTRLVGAERHRFIRTLNAVSCTSSSFCVAVDSYGIAHDLQRQPWSTPSARLHPDHQRRHLYQFQLLRRRRTPRLRHHLQRNSLVGTPTDIDSRRDLDAYRAQARPSAWRSTPSGYAVIYNGMLVDGHRHRLHPEHRRRDLCESRPSAWQWMHPATPSSTTAARGRAAADIDASRTIEAVSCPSSELLRGGGHFGLCHHVQRLNWSSPIDIDGINALEARQLPRATAAMRPTTTATSSPTTARAGRAPRTSTPAAAQRHLVSEHHVLCRRRGIRLRVTLRPRLRRGATADVDSTRAIDATTCVSSTFCVAVGTSGYATIYNGNTWSTPTDVDSSRTLDAVSCASASFCVAVDTSGYATIYNGTSWSTPTRHRLCRSTTPSPVRPPASVSRWAPRATPPSTTELLVAPAESTPAALSTPCRVPSSTFCEAVDTSGYAVKYTGSMGTAHRHRFDPQPRRGTCVSTTFCVAAGASGYAITYSAPSWSTPSDVDSSRTIKALSCTTFGQCVAVDASGYATTYNGTSGRPRPTSTDPMPSKPELRLARSARPPTTTATS